MVKGKGPELRKFKEDFLNEKHLIDFHQYIKSEDCFSNDIPGGICYFLWSQEYEGPCNFTLHNADGSELITQRYLNEGKLDIIIGDPIQSSIINKVLDFMSNHDIDPVSQYVSPRCPFNLEGNLLKNEEKHSLLPSFSENKFDNSYRIFGTDSGGRRISRYISNSYVINKGQVYIDKYKIFVGKATVGGQTLGESDEILVLSQPILAEINDVCTDSYEVIGPFETKDETINFFKYMKTRLFRFLLACRLGSQNITRQSYSFIPFLSDNNESDNQLYSLFGFNDIEIGYIQKKIGDVSWTYEDY